MADNAAVIPLTKHAAGVLEQSYRKSIGRQPRPSGTRVGITELAVAVRIGVLDVDALEAVVALDETGVTPSSASRSRLRRRARPWIRGRSRRRGPGCHCGRGGVHHVAGHAEAQSTPCAIGPRVLISISGSPSTTTSKRFTSRAPIHRSGG